MKFFFDENFPKAAKELLLDRGHECYDPRGTSLEGVADSVIVEKAQRMNAVILAADRDFFHTLGYLYPDHSGIIVIALKQPSRTAILGRLSWFLDFIDEDHLPARAFQL